MLLKQVGVVPGHDMTTEAALAKLSYLLALPDLSVEDITRQMSISLHGELTEHTGIAFEHPRGQLPQHLSSLSAMGYAIAKGNLAELQEILKGSVDWLLNEADYSGNTPVVGQLIFSWEAFTHVQYALAHRSNRTQLRDSTDPALERRFGSFAQ